MITACPSLICSFSTVNIEGTDASKICTCMFYVYVGTGFVG